MKRILAILIIGIVFYSCKGNQKEKENVLVVVSYGGSFQEAQRKAYFEPFEKETGIKVIEANWTGSGEYAKLKAMVQTENVSWDVVTVAEASIVERGVRDNILEKISFENIDNSLFYPESNTDHSVSFDFYSTVLAHRSDTYSEQDAPKNWKDFWDLEKYPGKRSLRRNPRTTLEFALLADGVEIDKLYPLDLDRAFKSLDKVKDQIIWWDSGHQPVQLLANKEVVMASAFNGRIWNARTKDGIPVVLSWDQGCLDIDAWIIPKGAKNYDNAMKLIEFTSRPEVQIDFTNYISYSPTIIEAYDELSDEAKKVLPTSPENYKLHFFFNAKWWVENEKEIEQRWNQWLLE